MSPEAKRAVILEALVMHHRVGMTWVTTTQLRTSGKVPFGGELINGVGRADFASGREVELDGERVVITYAAGRWTIA